MKTMQTKLRNSVDKKSLGYQIFTAIFILLIGGSVFFSLLFFHNPIFKTIAIYARNSFTTFIPIIGVMLFLTNLIKGGFGKFTRFILIICLFGFVLSGLWANVTTENNAIGGLLPRSDSSNYFADSLRIANGFKSSYFSSRPNYPAFIALLLLLTKLNMQISLAIIVFIAAIVSYLAFELILEKFSIFPAIVFFLLIFFYFRPFSGKFITESIGYILGILGFISFFLFVSKQKNFFYFLGLICLTFAFNVRPGPFFILPIAVLLLPEYKKADKKRMLYYVGGGLITVIFCFLFQYLYIKLFLLSGAIPFSNYASILYGLSKGGVGGNSVRTDFPDLFIVENRSSIGLLKPENVRLVFSLALQNIKNNPLNLIIGLIKQYILMFNISYKMGLFSFFYTKNKTIYYIFQYIIYGLSFFGLLNLLINKKYNINRMLAAILIGILLSIPFVPFTDQYQMRAYAGAIGFIALIPVIGLSFIINRLGVKKRNNEQGLKVCNRFFVLPLIIIVIIIFICVLPIGMYFIPLSDKTIKQTCENGYEPALIKFRKGTSINVYPENERFMEWLPNIHREKFITSVHLYPYDNFVKSLEVLDPPYSLTSTLDLLSENAMIMIISGNVNNLPEGTYSICGKWQSGDWNYMYARFYYVKTISPNKVFTKFP